MSKVKNYLSLIKFSHTIFAMPFALIGFFLGCFSLHYGVIPGWHTLIFPESTRALYSPFILDTAAKFYIFKLILVILCMVFARSAAMAFNRYLDRKFDAKNPRTAIREIPAGIINEKNALTFVIVNCILFVATTFFINRICFYLSPVALFVILFYSYTKRFTALCHLVLGVGLSLAPIGAYLAVTGEFALLPILFSFAVVFWVSGFDIIYALQDEGFDKENQLYSIPSVMGKSKALGVSILLHVLSAACVMAAGFYGEFGIWYWIGVGVFVGMLLYQHSIVKPDDLSRVNVAFMTANGIASVVFAVFVLLDLFLS
ncbi:UbiA-like polyprenyltransferase [Ferruginibacter sp. HRS2-29]|uniref:UbiA-like polyprenyltransferase n=1 Tax=Ferruginibacter sp. HRS2-29 TaxID=2487334 RepID=UPI0020CE4195|nr:UbiA-like polyprenyltransferase [Ferruginibacter sp. HRS2-29]MCP9751186.1 4-hydroxybenzoate octaprenyltransferase [Ferruginibacter sp. HRS2-29]